MHVDRLDINAEHMMPKQKNKVLHTNRHTHTTYTDNMAR